MRFFIPSKSGNSYVTALHLSKTQVYGRLTLFSQVPLVAITITQSLSALIPPTKLPPIETQHASSLHNLIIYPHNEVNEVGLWKILYSSFAYNSSLSPQKICISKKICTFDVK
jgi:hypothetical protein